ncbi:MAG: multiheme c-type cytochrome [Betaproteobacteria bacterium]|nr:multiheme c-type cytochrome [Betaproteobacteria bacterium]MDH3437601.1 multiheme c-type cytochrome [Betaproteobacteria bacterium]
MSRATFPGGLIASVASLLLFLSFGLMAAEPDPAAALSDADKQCLGCHGSEGMTKDLPNGAKLSLHIAAPAFAKSVHKAIGCAACHAGIDPSKHPGVQREIKDSREYSIAMTAVCRQCHDEAFKHYEGSKHANLQRQGRNVAPVCTDCHGSHAVTPKTAYKTCVGCHAADMNGHQQWLPNAPLHLEAVSCAACHAPTVQRMVDLRFYDSAAKKWIVETEDNVQFEKLAKSMDADNNGLDARELRDLVRHVNDGEIAGPKTLRGRIELRADIEAHRLAEKSQALRACDNCHRGGAEPFQNVAVSVVASDGRPLRYNAHKEVLSSLLSVETLRTFYAIGGTRTELLDVLLILALIGGLSVPIGHQMMKRIVQSREKASAAAGSPGGSGTGADNKNT